MVFQIPLRESLYNVDALSAQEVSSRIHFIISFFNRAGRIALLVFIAIAFAHSASGVIRDGGIDPANLGKGEWIYSFKDATNRLGGHINSVTNEASLFQYYKKIGVKYVMIKMGTGSTNYSGCYATPHQVTANLCNIARTNGVWVFGYTRSYGSNIAGEAALVDSVFNNGADGFIFDAEAEWESSRAWIGTNGPALAWQLGQIVRSNWPTKFIAHAPFPVIYFHSSFPYKEFGYWCDAVMPQVYHLSSAGLKESPSAVMNWMDVNYRTWQNSLIGTSSVIDGQTIYWTNSIKPIIPVQDVYGDPGNAVGRCNGTTIAYPDRDVMEFIDYAAADPNTATAGGYKGVNFWRADLHSAGQFANIAAGSSGNFSNIVNNIVIDDAQATRVGTWTAVKVFGSTTTTPTYYGATGTDTNSFGTNYWTKAQGTGSAYMQFRPNIQKAGEYDVYQWHVFRQDAATDVPFLIAHATGTNTVFANQQTNDGNWTLLGRFNFNAGTNATIRVMDNFSDPASIAIVDGLKLVYAPPTSIPSAPNGLTAIAIGSSQINLNWNDTSTNESNFIISRSTVSGGPYNLIATSGANSTSYTDTNLSSLTTYFYVVKATNILGASANSAQASATTTSGVPTAPIINTQPQSQTAIAGGNATFSVNAAASPLPTYQWRFNSSSIPGATNSAYTRSNVQLSDAGPYSVIVSNSLGSATSSNAMLTVHFSLAVNASVGGSVSKSPDQSSYAPGSVVTLTATGTPGFAFSGWTGDASGTSNPLNVTLTTNKSVVANFVSVDIIIDNPDPDVTFSGVWQTGTGNGKFGADYRFASTTSGGIFNVVYRPNIAVAGNYDVYIWYPQGSNRANNAPWTVSYYGGSVTVPVNQQINGGQWFLISSAKPFLNGTDGYVQLSTVGASPSVVLADAVRFLYIGALPPPSINVHPQSQSARVGTNVTFNVAATSSTPLGYQWRFGGDNIPSATQSSFTRSNVQTNHAGAYSVLVANGGGFVVSSNALLNVLLPTPPQFQSITRLPDGRIDLSVSGDNGILYWIDLTTNLVDWEPLTNVLNTNGTFEFIDGTATNRTKGFYRARE